MNKLTEFRHDFSGGITTKLDANGFLRVDGIAAKVGVLTYLLPDGNVRRELVTEDTLFNSDSMESLRGSPVTIEHPDIITPDNAQKHSKGSVPNVERKDKGLGVSIVVTNKDAINAVQAGKHQLSPGYQCQLDYSPGEWNGIKYDAIQTKRIYNHLAIVSAARGGSECKLNLDGFNCAVEVPTQNQPKEENKMATVILKSGATVEVENASTASALQNEINTLSSRADAAEGKVKGMVEKSTFDELQGRHDSLESELQKQKEDSEKRMDADQIGSFLETVENAKVLKADIEIKKDGKYLSESEIMAAALNLDSKDKSEEYIKGRFDSALELAKKEGVKKQREERTDGTEIPLTGLAKFKAEQVKARG